MEINLTNSPVYPADVATANAKKAEEVSKANEAEQLAEKQAEVGVTQEPDGFTKRPFQTAAVEDLVGPFQFSVASTNANGVTDVKTSNLQNLVTSMFGQQNTVANMADGRMNFLIDQATQDKAKAAIAEDGYWGAAQTSARLLDFAKALSGGDSSKIEELRSAVQDGYKAVANMFGGKLPEVSANTYDQVMAGFDAWANEAGAAQESPDAPTDANAVKPGETIVESK